MIGRTNFLVVAACLLAGCDSLLSDPPAAYFHATVEGAVQAEYTGSGTFSLGTRPTGQRTFLIYSRGEGSYAGHTFWIRNYDGGRLRAGTYPLELVSGELSDARVRGVGAQYLRPRDGEEHFVAETGELIIARSTSKMVEGRFTFTGFQYCRALEGLQPNPSTGQPCSIPGTAPTDAPRVTVTGSFRTVPADNRSTPSTP